MNGNLEKIKVALLAVIAICGIILVVQGFGAGTQRVYVEGGDIDADVSGTVSVQNKIDVNLDTVMGYTIGCHESYKDKETGKKYVAIDVHQMY